MARRPFGAAACALVLVVAALLTTIPGRTAGAEPESAREPDGARALTVTSGLPDGSWSSGMVEVADGDNLDAIAADLSAERDVIDVAPTLFFEADAESNDPFRRVSKVRPDPLGQWALDQVPFESTWDPTRGGGVDGTGVTVAVIDTGVASDHPDLVGRVLPGGDCTVSPAWAGYNPGSTTPAPCAGGWTAFDPHGHGTHVAGAIAANANNAVGIAGAAPGVSILPVRALNAAGIGSEFAIANAIKWAAMQGADVINLSLGTCINTAGYMTSGCAPAGSQAAALNNAVTIAANLDVVVVASAGNDSLISGYGYAVPAAYDGVVAVAAVDAQNARASFSNRGTWIDIAAPGVGIRSTATTANGTTCDDASGYALCSGTSMSAPYTAATAALVRAAAPTATSAQVIANLLTNASPLSSAATDVGVGLIDPLASVRDARSLVSSPSPTIARYAKGRDALSTVPVVAGTNERFDLTLEGSGFAPTANAPASAASPSAGITVQPVADMLDERVRLVVALTNVAPGLHDVSITTPSGTATCFGCIDVRTTGLPAPIGLTGTNGSTDGSLTMSWGAVAGATTYRIMIANSTSPVAVVEAQHDAARSFQIGDLDRDAKYDLYVRACGSDGACGPASSQLGRTPTKLSGTRPQGAYVWGISSTSAEINWDDDPAISQWRVTDWATGAIQYVNNPWVSLTGLQPSTTYHFGLNAGLSSYTDVAFTTLPAPPPPPPPPPPAPPAAVGSGYWMLGETGAVYAFGAAGQHGDALGILFRSIPDGVTAVDIEPTPSSRGYWVVDSLGRVFGMGDAVIRGNVPDLPPGERAVSMTGTATGNGYWVFTDRGKVYTFGDAQFLGSLAGLQLNGPIVSSIATPSGNGYYMVASDGGIFTFGDAAFRGSLGGLALNGPVVGLVPTPSNQGYWLVANDGGIFAFGDADFRGSMGGQPLNQPVTGMLKFGNGYLMVASDGGIFTFSDLPFHGSLGSSPPSRRIVTAATTG